MHLECLQVLREKFLACIRLNGKRSGDSDVIVCIVKVSWNGAIGPQSRLISLIKWNIFGSCDFLSGSREILESRGLSRICGHHGRMQALWDKNNRPWISLLANWGLQELKLVGTTRVQRAILRRNVSTGSELLWRGDTCTCVTVATPSEFKQVCQATEHPLHESLLTRPSRQISLRWEPQHRTPLWLALDRTRLFNI